MTPERALVDRAKALIRDHDDVLSDYPATRNELIIGIAAFAAEYAREQVEHAIIRAPSTGQIDLHAMYNRARAEAATARQREEEAKGRLAQCEASWHQLDAAYQARYEELRAENDRLTLAASESARTLQVEIERLKWERDDIAYKVEHPEFAHLHYDGCPFKPWSDKYDGDIPDPRPECTCGEAAKGAYWKGQHMLERGSHQLTRQERDALQAQIAELTRGDGVNERTTFERELESLINRYSQENASNTPDFILAQYLVACLAAFNAATQQRETWYGRDPRPSTTQIPEPGAGDE